MFNARSRRPSAPQVGGRPRGKRNDAADQSTNWSVLDSLAQHLPSVITPFPRLHPAAVLQQWLISLINDVE
ncbi:hypothetical protein E2C01_069551 [Portunus trituberculatus]|uniref:Uncharacterized protein n=1 Tax=Portunus trituberculatus TaxID=210409 RepID=A0A5B7I140_PORTR|nr:hypothetical protein [Portunus trituberculatus]